jgi:sugar transferase (PEP-CTERM system associated)
MQHRFNGVQASKYLSVISIDGALIFLTALLSAAIRLSLNEYNDYPVSEYDPSFVKTGVLTIVYLVAFYYFDLYTPGHYRMSRNLIQRLMQATLFATIALFGIFYLVPALKTWRGILLINTLVQPIVIIAWRALFSVYLSSRLPKRNVLVIGSQALAKKIGTEIYTGCRDGYNLIGFIDDDPTRLGVSIVNPGVIGGYGDIRRIVDEKKIDSIIVALPDRRARLPMSALLDCKLKGVAIEEGETFNERMSGQIPLDHLKPSWMVFSDGFKSLRSRKILKRAEDIVLSSACLAMALPVMLLTAFLIRVESKGPVIFRQERVGEHGRRFSIYKFRSMREDAEAGTGPVWAGKNDSRVTRVGGVIRLLRIDELPQLVNVLKGDMSFVGPRPERPFFVQKLKEVIPYYEIRTVVKPGITGWAQIKYPYGATVQDALEKLQYDIYYIKNMTPFMDLVIFLETVKVVFSGRGAR